MYPTSYNSALMLEVATENLAVQAARVSSLHALAKSLTDYQNTTCYCRLDVEDILQQLAVEIEEAEFDLLCLQADEHSAFYYDYAASGANDHDYSGLPDESFDAWEHFDLCDSDLYRM